MKFSSGILVLITSAVITSFAASIPQIEDDIRTISSSVDALEKSINALQSKDATLMQALAIRNNFEHLRISLEKGTADVNSTPHFSEGDGIVIFKLFESSTPTFIRALSNLITKKAAVKGLPVSGIAILVQQALRLLRSRFDAFEGAIIASEPNNNVKVQLKTIKARVDAAFDNAVAAYN